MNKTLIEEYILSRSFMDDIFMRYALNENIPCVEKLIRIVLNDYSLKVLSCKGQVNIPFLRKEGYLDILAEDENGISYNIEVQNKYDKNLPSRARYYSSLMDLKDLNKGSDYDQLPETFVIFLVKFDLFKTNHPIYHFQMKDKDIFENTKQHHLFVNVKHEFEMNELKSKNFNDLNNLFHDLQCTNSMEMVYDCYRNTMYEIKNNKKGNTTMITEYDEVLENIKHQMRNDIKNDIKKEEKSMMIKAMIKDGLDMNKIALYSSMDMDTLNKFIKENHLQTR